MINNFDRSSTGVNLELSCFLDTDESHCLFNELLVRYENERQSFVYKGWTILPDDFIDNAGQFKKFCFQIETTGYCQGDRATVYIPFLSLESAGYEVSQEGADQLKEHIDHLFWDTPLHCRLTVNGSQEFHFTEFMKSRYEYDKEELTEIAKKTLLPRLSAHQAEVVLNFLNNRLPEHPEYLH